MVDAAGTSLAESAGESRLHRVISWKDAFWVASGVPALVLFSIGGIAATVGTPSVLVWTLSVIFGFLQVGDCPRSGTTLTCRQLPTHNRAL
jgi:hypothetical protein